MICSLETLFHIAFGITETIAKIGAGEFFRRLVVLPHHFAATHRGVVHQCRVWRQRLVQIRHCRQFLVVDFNQFQSFLGDRLVCRRYRRHRIADVAHFVDRDDRLIFVGGAEHA